MEFNEIEELRDEDFFDVIINNLIFFKFFNNINMKIFFNNFN